MRSQYRGTVKVNMITSCVITSIIKVNVKTKAVLLTKVGKKELVLAFDKVEAMTNVPRNRRTDRKKASG